MTVGRTLLLLLCLAAAAVAAFGLFAASPAIRLPLVVSALAVLGIAATVMGFSLAGTAARFGRLGHVGRALLAAFIGGVFVLAAAGALAGAIVLGLLTGGT